MWVSLIPVFLRQVFTMSEEADDTRRERAARARARKKETRRAKRERIKAAAKAKKDT